MARNRSEKHPFPHVPARFMERLRLFAVWNYGTRSRSDKDKAHRVYRDYRNGFTDDEMKTYRPFMDTPDFNRIKRYWRDEVAP